MIVMSRNSARSSSVPPGGGGVGGGERVLVVVMSDSQYRALLSGIALAPAAPPPVEPRQPPMACGELELLLDEPVVHIGHGSGRRSATLPPTEHRLLACLMRHAERVCPRELLVAEVWPTSTTSVRTVDQYVRRLRTSLKRLGADRMVQTVNRAGYRLLPLQREAVARVGLVTADSQSLPTVTASTDGDHTSPCAEPPPNL